MKIEFIVPAPLLGYHQTTKKTMFHPKERARSEAYGQFKKNVLLLSMMAGAPNIGHATKEMGMRLSVEIFWKVNPVRDWKNVYGAIEDGIFYEQDQFVRPGKWSDVHCDTGREEAKVTMEWTPKKSGSGVRGNKVT
jgi:hypothetical protein